MTRTTDDLKRPDGNSLLENYDEHDDAEAVFLERLPDDIEVYPIGIDKRHNDESLIYDDRPDFFLIGNGGTALVDVKAKSSDRWMRFFNERHYRKYLDAADEYETPMYVYFYNTSKEYDIVCRLDGDSGVVYTTSEQDFMMRFPDRNNAAYCMPSTDVEFETFLEALREDDR